MDAYLFSSKLQELDREYGLLKARMELARGKDPEKLHAELGRLKDEIAQNDELLRQNVAYCHSPAVHMLAQTQLHYCAEMERLHDNLPKHMGETRQEKTEAAALYAEYAMDFATQSARFALAAALEAIDLQKTEETEEFA